MEWREGEQKRLCGALMKRCPDFGSRGSLGDIVAKEIGSLAVELAAARGGTMSAGDLEAWLVAIERERGSIAPIRQHIAALGARNAVLEADKETLRAEIRQARLCIQELRGGTRETVHSLEQQRDTLHARVAALEAERDDLRLRLAALEVAGAKLSEHVDKTAGGDLTTVEVARNAIGMPDDMDLICVACEQCTAHRWMPSPDAGPGWRCSECSALSKAGHYPCCPTCTHDDAATPGHSERVKERSEAFNKAAGGMDFHMGYESGADAMRAACWEAMQAQLVAEGIHQKSITWSNIKAAIEGATP